MSYDLTWNYKKLRAFKFTFQNYENKKEIIRIVVFRFLIQYPFPSVDLVCFHLNSNLFAPIFIRS